VRSLESEQQQLDKLDEAYDRLEQEQRRHRSLLEDPQRIERELDAKGLLPPGHPARKSWDDPKK
jgi:hypothetical protein